MNSRFIDIVALLDDAVLNNSPVIIDSCRYYPTWDKENEMYRLMDCFGGSFSLEQDQIDEWKWEGHEIEYDA
jgi:hypothetical protein